ncbi:hypothetical protein BU23DRAFT_568215 [Bimuria novae-zelandiae CBS 107.79]|uniref:Uncharacterized protein n=1 Tax=Bimuria novae-zelandiae CBS 107.79 TaxID=1447943 RepID=A0A6A5V7Y3_9PLEO|nr:hypothetical protein BU23DRAFT_568215 [Bimuria novae-zelandiae CBS 107.79]
MTTPNTPSKPAKKRGIHMLGSDGETAILNAPLKSSKKQKQQTYPAHELLAMAKAKIAAIRAKYHPEDNDPDWAPDGTGADDARDEADEEFYATTTLSEGVEDLEGGAEEASGDEEAIQHAEGVRLTKKDAKQTARLRNEALERRNAQLERDTQERIDRFEYDVEFPEDVRDDEIHNKFLADMPTGGYCILEPDARGRVTQDAEDTFRDDQTRRTMGLTSQQPCRGMLKDPKDPNQRIPCPGSISKNQRICRICMYSRLDSGEEWANISRPKRGFIADIGVQSSGNVFTIQVMPSFELLCKRGSITVSPHAEQRIVRILTKQVMEHVLHVLETSPRQIDANASRPNEAGSTKKLGAGLCVHCGFTKKKSLNISYTFWPCIRSYV